ncbi:nicotinamide n-methyltransferase [Kappamyces sp. JEL0680]|nr:nicotinamide n-methyltransferase [Kappamyces sp. JEL0680]
MTESDQPNGTAVSDDGFELEGTAMFEEPSDFRPPSPLPTTSSFRRQNGQELTVHLPPQHSLWAHKLWNAGQSLAHYLDSHCDLVAGKRVLEMGAAASLPSMIAAINGAALTVSTDYPDPVLLDNIAKNARANIPALYSSGSFVVQGFLWGDEEIIQDLARKGPFDVILLADVIFNHSQHENLLRSCKRLLAPQGCVLTTYSHHGKQRQLILVTKWADRDMVFFDIARALGFVAESLYTEKWQEMFPEDAGSLDLRQTVCAWKLELK